MKMNIEFIKEFRKIHGQDVYIFADALDFTNEESSPKIIVKAKGASFSIPIPKSRKELYEFCGSIKDILCNPDVIVISWGIKDFISYILAKTGQMLKFGTILDLKILESYLGTKEQLDPPETFVEAQNRLKVIIGNKHWEDLKPIYSRIYLPLITRVVPEIESIGVINRRRQKRVHAHYDIAGQINGRMRCSEILKESFNPHSITRTERPVLSPPSPDDVFLCLDYKHMEVSVLQWLSSDPLLGQILDSGVDCYRGIWQQLTSLECTDQTRNACKSLFLPVVFGMGAGTLSKRLDIGLNVAERLISRIYVKFETAIQWIKRQVELVKNDIATDVFYRHRKVSKNEQYKIRNFVIQSPAALFCLSKLVKLHKELEGKARIGFHVHDEYVLYARKHDRRRLAKLAIEVLESESSLFPGMKLSVSCKIGENLIDLTKEEYERDN